MQEVLSNIRSKGKNKPFDEKGVFGRVCRHNFPKGFISIKYDEWYGNEYSKSNVSDRKVLLELLHALSFAHGLWPLCKLYSFTYKDKF